MTSEKTDTTVNILGLNVCGLHKKSEYGILEKYIHAFDIICLSETKTDDIDADIFPGYQVYCKVNKRKTHPLGGIHGISVLYKDQYAKSINFINDLSSDCVQWAKVDKNAFGFDFILGSTYIPHETSKYFNSNIFEDLEDDIVNLKSRFDGIPICLIGDFNSRTGLLNDFISLDVDSHDISTISDTILDSKNDLTSLGFCTDRHSLDKRTNKNGQSLIDLCRCLDIHIINGRFGDDMNQGKLTCDNASVIDYAIASPDLFPKVGNFYVDIFDKLLSDKHNPICLSLVCSNYAEVSNTTNENVSDKASSDSSNRLVVTKNWDRLASQKYYQAFKGSDIESVASLVDSFDYNIDQTGMDNLSDAICEAYIKPANDVGLVRILKGGKNKASARKASCKPWFTKDCRILRSKYFKSKRKYKRTKSSIDKKEFRENGLLYKRFIRKAKKAFTREFQGNLRNVKTSNPREYWQILNNATNKSVKSGNVDTSSFFNHFSKLNQSQNPCNSAPSDTKFDPRSINHSINQEINKPIDESEIWVQIKKLKNNKSAGVDSLTNELLKNCPNELVTITGKLFNLILNTGVIPSNWTKGIIKPIFKNKGSPDDPDNYRGITLLSCLGKLFTAILNKRLSDYVEVTGILGEEQAGFREGYSTTDHIFTLYSIIDLYLHKGKRVYCAFIDYKKAFDLIDRTSLWLKLISNGINGKVITVIHNMYNNAKSCVMNGNEESDFFNCNMGVRQGENLSPLLFAMFLNDFELFISKYFNGLSDISKDIRTHLSDDDVEVFLKLFTLLYADDTVVFAESECELQRALDAVSDYCRSWHLTVNTSKTKIVIFSRGKVKKCRKFKFGDNFIETVDDFNYLGTKFNYNNKLKKPMNKQVVQARRAMFSLISKARQLDLPIDIQMELFDQLVQPILLYGCEVWAFDDISVIEKLYLKFCKQVLGLRSNTTNCMVYGELGRSGIRTVVDKRLVMYWYKLVRSKSSKLSNITYRLLRSLYDKGVYHSPWLKKIKSILDNVGLSYLWNSDLGLVNITWLKNTLKGKLDDIFRQNWNAEVNANSTCTNYRIFKSNLQFENYLVTLNQSDRIWLCKFRCGNSKLPINTGRYKGIARQDRFCSECTNHQLGDEFHYLFECPSFEKERKRYLKACYRVRPNTFKMSALMDIQKVGELSSLAKFCRCIMKKFE